MIVISGASRGIGKFLMEAFLNENEQVLGIYNRTKPVANTDVMCQADITKSENIENILSRNKDNLNKIILLNCAGANYNSFAHKADMTKWTEIIHVNLIGTFNMINAFLPIMRSQNYGRIVNFSSVVAQAGVPGTSAYAASKAGLWGMTKAISGENASKNITVNNLNLGYFQIGMIDEVPMDIQETIKKKIPIMNFGDPADILSAVKFLITNSYITGTSLDINGGMI